MNAGLGVEGFPHQQRAVTERVIGVFYSVANELGIGFVESIYRRAMVISLREAGLQVAEEVAIPVWFHGENIGTFKADIVVGGTIVLELKTGPEISKAHEAQLLHYLRSSTMEVGYVMVFGEKARFRRVLMINDRKRLSVQVYPS